MASLYLIIPIVLLFTGLAFAVFYWAVQSKQYEDVERHGSDILYDEEPPHKP